MNSTVVKVIFFTLINIIVTVFTQRDMGPGLWSVKNVNLCPDNDDYPIQINITRTILNRTHDAYDCYIELPQDLGCEYGVLADIYKLCDGGYKYQQKIEDAYACTFIEENSNDNFLQAVTLAGLPPICPIPEGKHSIKKFMMNYDDLPEQCIYGIFRAQVTLIKEEVAVACILVELECEEKRQTDAP